MTVLPDTLAWPDSSETVIEWARASLRPDDGVEIVGLDDIEVSATLVGADLEHLTLDATGVSLRIHSAGKNQTHAASRSPSQLNSSLQPNPVPAVATRRRGTAHFIRFNAAPVRVEGFPVAVDVQLSDAPIEWLSYQHPVMPGRPESAYLLDLADDGAGMQGSAVASVRTDDIGPLLSSILQPALREAGVRLRRLNLRVAQDGEDGIRIEGSAAIRWRLLTASARGAARLSVSRDGLLIVHELSVGSRNPIVAVALGAVRKVIRSQVGRSHDLNALIAGDDTAPRLHDVRVIVDEDINVSARIG
jgi:hypothetical protein